MKIGVYVGSFDPLHLGHEQIINKLLKNKIVDKIIIVPGNSYWNKKINSSIKHRINMLKLIENKNVIINDTLYKKKYTYQVLNELNKQYDNLYLIIGADNIINFDKWKNIDCILNHHVIIVSRNNIDINKYLKNYPKENFTIVDDVDIKTSSTIIRNKIKQFGYESIIRYVNNDIINYIIKNKLYK
jgi:nicotinate-nucleotide adenylyltransferase